MQTIEANLRTWKPPRQKLGPEAALFGLGFLFSAMVVGLLVVVFWTTFQEGLPGFDSPLSLANYKEAFLDTVTFRAALNSLLVGAGTVFVNTIFGVPIAWLIHRTNVPFKSFFMTLMFVGVAIPGFLQGIAWILLLSPQIGSINQFLRLWWSGGEGPLSVYNLPSIAFVQGLLLTPVMFLMMSAAFKAIDSQLEEAAETAGATRLAVLRRITAPLVMPAFAAAVIYNFMTAVSMFEIPALLGFPAGIHVLSTLLFYTVNTEVGTPQYGLAGVYGILLLVPTLIGLYFYHRLLRRSSGHAVVSGKGYRGKLLDLGRWKWVAVGFIAFFFSLNLFLPLLVLLWISSVPYVQIPSARALASVSLEAYREAPGLLSGGQLGNTLFLVAAVAMGVLFFSTIISWMVVRTRMRGRFVLDTIAMLPHATPSLAFAFAVVIASLSLARVVPIYGTLWMIVIAHMVAYISYGTRSLNGALVRIHPDLEDAVHICGGTRFTVLRKVILPILGPDLFYCGLWVALLSFRELTMALFLQSPRNEVISVTIWNLWAANKPAAAAALGVMTFGAVAIMVPLVFRAASRYMYSLRSG